MWLWEWFYFDQSQILKRICTEIPAKHRDNSHESLYALVLHALHTCVDNRIYSVIWTYALYVWWRLLHLIFKCLVTCSFCYHQTNISNIMNMLKNPIQCTKRSIWATGAAADFLCHQTLKFKLGKFKSLTLIFWIKKYPTFKSCELNERKQKWAIWVFQKMSLFVKFGGFSCI